jgi:valyl-tRNA synthetase
MVANSSKIPFEQLAFSGMVLNQFGKKISKYDPNAPLLDTLEKFNPDCVRLGLLKQSFGKDFKSPRFEEEEKFRRKIFNCVRYLSNCSRIIEDTESNYPNQKLKENYDKILVSLTSFKFKESYEGFRKFIYQQISKNLIDKSKLKGISVGTREEALRLIKNLGEIFIPKSLDDF